MSLDYRHLNCHIISSCHSPSSLCFSSSPWKKILKIPIIVGIMPLAVIIICYDLDDNNEMTHNKSWSVGSSADWHWQASGGEGMVRLTDYGPIFSSPSSTASYWQSSRLSVPYTLTGYIYSAGLTWSELELVKQPRYLNLLLGSTIWLVDGHRWCWISSSLVTCCKFHDWRSHKYGSLKQIVDKKFDLILKENVSCHDWAKLLHTFLQMSDRVDYDLENSQNSCHLKAQQCVKSVALSAWLLPLFPSPLLRQNKYSLHTFLVR